MLLQSGLLKRQGLGTGTVAVLIRVIVGNYVIPNLHFVANQTAYHFQGNTHFFCPES